MCIFAAIQLARCGLAGSRHIGIGRYYDVYLRLSNLANLNFPRSDGNSNVHVGRIIPTDFIFFSV